jgi:ferric-dicitrate binding protein FerR (iron transport regulator)
MINNRFWLLAAKRFSGDATKEELHELGILISELPNGKQLFEEAENAWNSSHSIRAERTDLQESLQKLRKKLQHSDPAYDNAELVEEPLFEPRSKKRLLRYMVPAAIALAIAAYFIFNQSGNSSTFTANTTTTSDNTVFAPKGSRKTNITLPDGSTVLLNADSRIYYGNDFASRRELKLEGEAYFDVVRNMDKPFVIHTADMDVKVLGTAFNIRSYPGETVSEASLIRGSIEVSVKNRKDPITLQPNDKIIVTSEKTASLVEQNDDIKPIIKTPQIEINSLTTDENEDLIKEIAWTKNRLYIEGERLDNAVLLLERWFGKKIIIENENIKGIRYTGNFETESLETILKAFQLSVPFKYRIENEIIVIY